MVDDDISLDSLITESKTHATDSSESVSVVAPRPKLKKIKRPKVRPQPDIPPAPEKITVTGENLSPVVEESVEDVSENIEQSSTGTELMTAVEAQNLATEEAERNPYVLEGLPPDLDFNSDVAPEFDDGSYVKKNIVYSIATVCLIVGIVLGFVMAPKGSEQHGLEDVAWNDETPKGRVRCGKTDSSQACTFYILNSFKQDLTGRDFFKLAAQLTGREEFMIETENMQYATTKIKPGFFVQLNIPALK